jgi:hypothetical protein
VPISGNSACADQADAELIEFQGISVALSRNRRVFCFTYCG